jgi:predicted nucleic acid-binding protein
VTIVVDTSGLQAVLVQNDVNHLRASQFWNQAVDQDLVAHAYVVTEAIALVRARLGWAGVDTLLDELLPALRVEMVDQRLHEDALASYRAERGGTSFVDSVTIEFARRTGIEDAFAFDRDLLNAGLKFPSIGTGPG